MSTARKCQTKYLAKSAFIYSIVAGGLLLGAHFIFAQESQRKITISPPTVEKKVNPADRKEGMLKVTNGSDISVTYKAVVRDFVVDNPDGIPHVLVGDTLSTKYSASAWIGVSPDSFSLAPGKTQELTYYLQVPADARPGGHYAAVVYEPQEQLSGAGVGAGVETHVGTLFYVRVNGNIVENATVRSFTAPSLQEYGPVTINTQIANYSDTDIRPIGTITVKNLLGQTVDSQALQEHNIYPEAARNFTNKIGEKKFMFGPYTATLNAKYGSNNNLTLFASTSFMILPWKIVAIVLLVVIVIILFLIWRKKKKKNHVEQPNQPQPEPQPQPQPEAQPQG